MIASLSWWIPYGNGGIPCWKPSFQVFNDPEEYEDTPWGHHHHYSAEMLEAFTKNALLER